jgi:hypothetical protein
VEVSGDLSRRNDPVSIHELNRSACDAIWKVGDLRVEPLRHKLRTREANESIRSPRQEQQARHQIEEDHWTETQKPISEVTVLYLSQGF